MPQSYPKNYNSNLHSGYYSKNNNPKHSNDDNAEESSEWEFDQSAQKASSNEWEFKGAERSEAASTKKNKNREAKELQAIKVPCFSPGCKTWIKITFPKEGSIEGGITTTEAKKKSLNGVKGFVISRPASLARGISSKKPKLIEPKPIGNVEKVDSIPIKSITENLPVVTTRKSIASYMFSTSWILSLKRVTIPMPSSSSVTNSPISTPKISIDISDKNIETTPNNTAWIKPFTLKPIKKTSDLITTATVGPAVIISEIIDKKKNKTEENNKNILPSLLTEKNKKPKPWTHSSSSGNSMPKSKLKKAKHRPPPTTGATIEEAAIWVSWE